MTRTLSSRVISLTIAVGAGIFFATAFPVPASSSLDNLRYKSDWWFYQAGEFRREVYLSEEYDQLFVVLKDINGEKMDSILLREQMRSTGASAGESRYLSIKKVDPLSYVIVLNDGSLPSGKLNRFILVIGYTEGGREKILVEEVEKITDHKWRCRYRQTE